jgi:uncharacterized protein (TIGR02246 family)
VSTVLRETSSADEQAVRALYQRLMDGWNQGSGAAFAEPMAGDVDFVPFDGVPIKGKEALARFHDPLFKTHLKGTRLVGEVTSVRLLSPTVALMHARGGTIMRGESKASPARDSIQTMVAVKGENGWNAGGVPEHEGPPHRKKLRGDDVVAADRLAVEIRSAPVTKLHPRSPRS